MHTNHLKSRAAGSEGSHEGGLKMGDPCIPAYHWLAGNEEMDKKMETTFIGDSRRNANKTLGIHHIICGTFYK